MEFNRDSLGGALRCGEQGGTDSDESGAFKDTALEIMGHAHGKIWKGFTKEGFEAVAEGAEVGKAGADDCFVLDEGGHSHEAADVDVREGESVFH